MRAFRLSLPPAALLAYSHAHAQVAAPARGPVPREAASFLGLGLPAVWQRLATQAGPRPKPQKNRAHPVSWRYLRATCDFSLGRQPNCVQGLPHP